MINSIYSYRPQAVPLHDRASAFFNPIPSRIARPIHDHQALLIQSSIPINEAPVPIYNIPYKDENHNNTYSSTSLTNNFNDSFANCKQQLDDIYLNKYNYSKEINSMSSPNGHYPQRRKFSLEEDCKLKKLIEINGPRKWDQVALSMPGRTGRQCRDRYHNYLDPSLTNGPWTIEEDNLLEQKVNEIGQHWNKIIKFFKGRSTNNIKNRWYTYLCRQNKEHYQELSSQNIEKNYEPIECQLSKNDDNKKLYDLFGDNYNYIQKKSDVEISGNSAIPIIEMNRNNYQKLPFSNHFDNTDKNLNLDASSPNMQNKKKIFFPLICPPDDSLIFPLDLTRLNFLGQEC